MRRIAGNDLAGDEPVKQHADAREVLFDSRNLAHLAHLRDVHRLHVLDTGDAPAPAPGQEPARRKPVGRARVHIADIDGEEFKIAPDGPLPCPVNRSNGGTWIDNQCADGPSTRITPRSKPVAMEWLGCSDYPFSFHDLG